MVPSRENAPRRVDHRRWRADKGRHRAARSWDRSYYRGHVGPHSAPPADIGGRPSRVRVTTRREPDAPHRQSSMTRADAPALTLESADRRFELPSISEEISRLRRKVFVTWRKVSRLRRKLCGSMSGVSMTEVETLARLRESPTHRRELRRQRVACPLRVLPQGSMTHPMLARRVAAAVIVIALRSQAQVAPVRPASPPSSEALAAHALNRLTFGSRPGDVERVLRMGLDRWIEQQLDPESIADSAGAQALIGCPFWTDPVNMAGQVEVVSLPRSPGSMGVAAGPATLSFISGNRSEHAGDFPRQRSPTRHIRRRYLPASQLVAGRLTRAEFGDQQVLEVMTDFWENHFSGSGERQPHGLWAVEWDRAVRSG